MSFAKVEVIEDSFRSRRGKVEIKNAGTLKSFSIPTWGMEICTKSELHAFCPQITIIDSTNAGIAVQSVKDWMLTISKHSFLS
jgi:hypothetical protein